MPPEETYNRIFKGSSSALRKVAVCTFFGATFSVGLVLTDESLRDQWLFLLAAGAVMGLFAGAFLVWRDARRSRNQRWRAKCEERARQLLERGEAGDPDEALRSAQAQVAEETSGCIVWIGMILGGLSLLGGAIMLVIKIVEAVRRGI